MNPLLLVMKLLDLILEAVSPDEARSMLNEAIRLKKALDPNDARAIEEAVALAEAARFAKEGK